MSHNEARSHPFPRLLKKTVKKKYQGKPNKRISQNEAIPHLIETPLEKPIIKKYLGKPNKSPKDILNLDIVLSKININTANEHLQLILDFLKSTETIISFPNINAYIDMFLVTVCDHSLFNHFKAECFFDYGVKISKVLAKNSQNYRFIYVYKDSADERILVLKKEFHSMKYYKPEDENDFIRCTADRFRFKYNLVNDISVPFILSTLQRLITFVTATSRKPISFKNLSVNEAQFILSYSIVHNTDVYGLVNDLCKSKMVELSGLLNELSIVFGLDTSVTKLDLRVVNVFKLVVNSVKKIKITPECNSNVKQTKAVKESPRGRCSSNKKQIQPNSNKELIEALSVPIEIEYGVRIMQRMGWKGGALGNRGGITEPIMPSLHIVPGTGLGHKSEENT